MSDAFTLADLRVAAAVNDRAILANCLQRSPDIASESLPLQIYEGFDSAGDAYNCAIEDAGPGRILILVHQDVYLPSGYGARLVRKLNELTYLDPDWAVAGLIGLDRKSTLAGHVWSTGLQQEVRGSATLPCPVESLDELLLILRTSNSPRFDPKLSGFHLYGTDIIQLAKAERRNCYAIDAPVVHHDKVIIALDHHYKKAWRYMRRKWSGSLPIPTLIAPLTTSMLTLTIKDLRVRWWRRGHKSRVVPTSDPSEIAVRLGYQ